MMEYDSTRDPGSWDRAQELIQGSAKTGLEELFDLIHRINPTGSSLAGEARDRAYELKAGLQSLLIEHHGEQLELEEVERTILSSKIR